MSIMNDEQNDPNQIESIVKNIKISNETLSNGYEYTKFENQKASPGQRKLILHFDNRNTLQVANNVSSTTIEQGVNNFLTGVLWGYEDDNGEWKWISESPSLQKPKDCLRCITYFKYLEDQIVKEPAHRKDLRFRTGNFISNEGQDFRRFYNDLIESLRYYSLGSPGRADEDSILNKESANNSDGSQRPRRLSILHAQEVPVNGFRSVSGTLYHYILPAFFRLIQYLQDTNRNFVIYLRTMGDDSGNFLANAQRVLSNEHPSFKFTQPLEVNSTPGRIERPNNGIRLTMKLPDDTETEILTDEFKIHEKLENGHGIHAIKDDFNAWCSNDYHYTTSKPIWFDPDDPHPRSHHILFDDNFRVIDPHDSIVDIRIMNRDQHRCYSCPFEYYPKLENIFAVQADLYLILADKDYYVKAVQQCERNLDELLRDTQTLQNIKQKSTLQK